MLYIILAALTLIIVLICALDRATPAQDDSQVITYTQAGKVSDGSLWKR